MVKVKQNLEMDEKGFIFDPETGHSYNLNPAARHILNQLRSGASLPQIADSLQHKYKIDRRTAVTDLDDFLRQLKGLELISSDEVINLA